MKTDPSDGASPIELTIMLCTFHREALLLKALRSALAMPELSALSHEFVIVDNSDEGTARAAVDAFAAETSAPVRYVDAHPANISVARNVGLAAARGTYVAMIDDDMTLQRGWLKGLAPHLRAGKYDVLFGPLTPEFEDPSLATPEARQFFSRDAGLGDGAPVVAFAAGRTRGFTPGSGNAILRRETCFGDADRFNVDWGRVGGEDTDFFCNLERRGRRFGWAANAATNEFVPIDRCSDDYLARRSFVGGQTFAASRVLNSDRPALAALEVALIASAQWLIASLNSLVSTLRSIDRQRHARIRLAAVSGKLAWRRRVVFYGDAPKSTSAP